MADCSYARCMQERRTIKKHLQKWTKNCIYTLGFERVAEEFMGRRKWKLYQERVLRSWCPSIEREIEIKDWDPSEDKCSFCDLEPSGKVTDEEPASPLRSDCYGTTRSHNNNNHIELLEGDESDSNSVSSAEDSIPTMNALDSMSVSACHAAMAALARSSSALVRSRTAPNPLLFQALYQPGLFPSSYLTHPPKPLIEGIVKNEPPMVMNLPASAGSEMPLDLSAKSSKPPPTNSPEIIRSPNIMDNKPMMKGRSRTSPMSGRRAYTENELQAALNDIRSGKLGTRRAAVIYGIPRSTLRNKVYKLALERERDAQLTSRPSPPDGAASSPSLPAHPEKEDSSAEEEKDAENAKAGHPLGEEYQREDSEDLKALVHYISRRQEEGVNMKEMLALGDPALGSYLTQLLKPKENVSPETEKASEEKESEDGTSQDGSEKGKYSSLMLSELMRHIRAENRLKRKMASENGVDEDRSNMILRIPSFKPNASCSKTSGSEGEARSPQGASQENSRHSVISLNGESESPPGGKVPSLKDAIAKGIGQKFQQDSMGLGQDAMDALKHGGFSQLTPSQHSVLKNHFDRNQRPQHASAQTNAQGKGTRPKRGKYRNYDRDSLVEAVRAVQRGEMSVHRAGSYYGVPHSTLEYKVKERHLMRPRKREPKGEDKTKLPPSGGSSASAAASEKPKQLTLAPKPSVKPSFPAALPNGLKMPPSIFETGVSSLAYAGTPFSFWPPTPFPPLPLDISPGAFPPEQLFAPQIMRGNLETPPSPSALPPNTRRIAESLYDGNNGSFLDGIIRSSLEMGLNASQKHDNDSEKSGKNTEKMSNKALLDQLCRNSRLTPVPRPSAESNSDEEAPSRNVPYNLSRSSDDDNEERKSGKGCADGSRQCNTPNRGEDKRKRSRSIRSPASEENNRSEDEGNVEGDVPSPDDLQNLDEDMDNISNHASEEEDAKDS